MKLIELFEGRAETIAKNQEKKILFRIATDSSANRNANALDVVNQISDIDPKSVQALVNMYIKGAFRLEHLPEVKQRIIKFNSLKNKLPNHLKSLNNIGSLKHLDMIIDEFSSTDVVSNKKIAKEKRQQMFASGEAQRIYSGKTLVVDIPKTEAASCALGQFTKWCTTGDKNNQFHDYNDRGNLYVISTRDGNKYLFFFGNKDTGTGKEFQDSLKRDVDVEELTKKYPELFDAFDNIAREYNYLPLIKNKRT